MITPRRTRLVRVPDLHAFRHTIAALALDDDVDVIRARAVVVPTRGARRQLRRTLEDHGLQRGRVIVLPEIVTRGRLYDCLHERLPDPPLRLNPFERDAIAQASAQEAAACGPTPSFQLRPGLIAEMLRFYDHLRRQAQPVNRFEELITEALAGEASSDRGAERMRQQTRFLAKTFHAYERRILQLQACDEHTLRERLIAEPAPDPMRHVIVTTADWIADPEGLFVADFDMLARIPGLEVLDIVSTEPVLGSGFHERLHDWLPGLEELGPSHLGVPESRVRPVLMTPADAAQGQTWFTYRDRSEELAGIARQIKADRRPAGDFAPLDRTAVVFKRPLPYLYLASGTIGAAGIPYQASDGLPLAAEPTAAAIDLVLELVASSFTREAIVALLRSPHFRFDHDGREMSRDATSALDRALSESRYLGELGRLEQLAAGLTAPDASAALSAALGASRVLAPLAERDAASRQIRRVLSFVAAHARPHVAEDPFAPRERRARSAIVDMLEALAMAHAAHHDVQWTIDELVAAVRRWTEEQTFVSGPAGAGLHLVDDQAVRYGDFDDITIVGMIENDWPDRPRRNIFYPPGLLNALGWPSEKDRRGAADARFLEVLASASRRVTLSSFTLDEESLVSPSPQLDEVPRARLSTVARASSQNARVFVDEALMLEPVVLDVLSPDARGWGEVRSSRVPADAPDFHGHVGVQAARPWSVSALETYLGCPFKFFAQHVLRLEEEPDDEEVMDPRQEGQFVHEVFATFFDSWQAAGWHAITPANLDRARDMFAVVVDGALERLPAAEAGLARTRLLGSSAAAGLGEAVLRMEAERPVAVVERLLEHRLEGEFTMTVSAGARTVSLRGKADRVDLLEDGTFRLIDYKLGWPPNRARAIQLPIYSTCAEQRLANYRGRNWTLGEAVYLAFKGPRRVVPLFASPADRVRVLAEAQQRLTDTLDAIERGEFPPTPDDVHRCESCSFASVCRKDYVGDV